MSKENQNVQTQQVSAIDFIYTMLEKAHKKDFNGFNISESAGIQNALIVTQEALVKGDAAIAQIQQSNKAVKNSPELLELDKELVKAEAQVEEDNSLKNSGNNKKGK